MRDVTPLADPIDAAPTVAGSEPPALLTETAPPGLIRRAATVARHLGGLGLGLLADRARRLEQPRRRTRLAGFLARRLVRRDLVDLPFAVQLRRRLELLGPTFIKLGQVLAVRRDLLPRDITEALSGLLDRLPAVSYERFVELVSEGLGRPAEALFAWIETQPIGSASIAQIHRASTRSGDAVIIKVVKPGIREILERDARLLRLLGRLLQLPLARYQPRRVIDELVTYTLFEVDLHREADNAETFRSNFADLPDVVFPRVYRHLSSLRVLTMDFFAGVRPDSRAAQDLDVAERRRIVDLGAEAIVRMIYRDGFFHADLHPGNLLVLSGPKAGFIDLGMVGRLGARTRRALLSYYYCLVMGDAEGAARYLASVAEPGRRADVEGFRRAATEVSRQWFSAQGNADQGLPSQDFASRGFASGGFAAEAETTPGGVPERPSLAQLILESIGLGGRYRMFFPVEMVLMVKALVTFEGVGGLLVADFDVAAVSRRHVAAVLLESLSPLRVAREGLRLAPELLDAVSRAPLLVTEGLRLLERGNQAARQPTSGVAGGALFGGLALVAGALVLTGDGPWQLAAALFATGVISALAARR